MPTAMAMVTAMALAMAMAMAEAMAMAMTMAMPIQPLHYEITTTLLVYHYCNIVMNGNCNGSDNGDGIITLT